MRWTYSKGVRNRIDFWRISTDCEILPQTLELATDPAIVGLFTPTFLQLLESRLKYCIRTDGLGFWFLRQKRVVRAESKSEG